MGKGKRITSPRICGNCKCNREDASYYRDPSKTLGEGALVCRNCYSRWQKWNSFQSGKGKPISNCGMCNLPMYYIPKWGSICSYCKKGKPLIKNTSGVSIKNPSFMSYDEKETCRRLVVKWKRGWLQPIDYYKMIDIYLEYHFKNEELDSLKMDRQLLKIMTWIEKLFKKDLVCGK
jgi:hypothetical protein